MKKNLLFVALAGALLAGCSTSDVETSYEQEVLANSQVPIAFGTYLGNAATTRAARETVAAGTPITTDNIHDFGVFAYYTTSELAADATPNFMFNQEVKTTDGSAWSYTPLKYWPNGNSTSNADTQSATGGSHYLSFFAYAPYLKSESSDKFKVNSTFTNATGLKIRSEENAWKNRPNISVTLDSSSAPIDLLYATGSTTNANLVDGSAKYSSTDFAAEELTSNKQNINMTKVKNGQKVAFTFHHAFARIKDVQVKTDLNPSSASEHNVPKVIITSLKLMFTTSKTGNLDITTGKWYNLGTVSDLEYNISSTTSNVNTALFTTANTSTSWEDITTTGVTSTAASIYADSKFPLITLIPGGTGNKVKAEITYEVMTKDTALPSNKSYVSQTVTKTIDLSSITAQTQYSLTLVLGLNSVDFTVTSVDAWPDTAETTTINLPKNESGS